MLNGNCRTPPENHNDIPFSELINTVRNRIRRVQRLEKKEWGGEACLIELSKQVGDLAKCVMLFENYYHEANKYADPIDLKALMEDELADIFYMLVRIADYYALNLVSGHLAARAKEDKFLRSNGV